MQLNNRKMNDPIKEWAKNLNTYLSKEGIKMANKHMKRCSTSFFIREITNQNHNKYHLTLVRMAIIKKSTNNKYQGACGEKGTLLHYQWECKLLQPLWRTVWRFLKKKKKKQNRTAIQPSNPTAQHIPKANRIERDTCTTMFIAPLFTIASRILFSYRK